MLTHFYYKYSDSYQFHYAQFAQNELSFKLIVLQIADINRNGLAGSEVLFAMLHARSHAVRG